jgi:glycine oxidase
MNPKNNSTHQTQSLAILGAGIAGRLTALYLAEAGFSVTLFDQSFPSAESTCSFVAAGMLCPWSEAFDAEEEIFTYGVPALARWRDIDQKYFANTLVKTPGTLVIAHQQEAGLLGQFFTRLKTRGVLEKPEPQNTPLALHHEFKSAGVIPGEGHLDPKIFLEKSSDILKNLGVNLQIGIGPCTIQKESNTWILQEENSQQSHTFHFLIDTRGLGAKPLLPHLRGVRGELLRLRLAPQTPQLPYMVRILHTYHSVYLVPRDNGELIVGATSLENENPEPIYVKSILELLFIATSAWPELREASLLETLVQWRPAFADHKPHIEVHPLAKNTLITLNGLYRHGILCAPELAYQVVQRVKSH